MAPSVPRTRRDVGDRGRVEVGAAFGDLAKPDRRKVRARLGLDGDRLDEGADLVGRVAGGRAASETRRADGLEHVAEDFAVERGLAGEVVVDHRLVDARGAGDAIDAGAGEARGRRTRRRRRVSRRSRDAALRSSCRRLVRRAAVFSFQ